MNYPNGDHVQIGDTVDLGGNRSGVIVGIIHDGRYADGYRGADWAYLGSGLIVSTEFGDLRLEEPDEDMALLSRPEPRVLRDMPFL